MNADDLAGTSIDAARRMLASAFKDAGLESPALDARLLAGGVTALDLTGLTIYGDRLLTPDEARCLSDFANRRLRGEPVARILGAQEFWGLTFALSSDTLVPRPDTETLVQEGLNLLRAHPGTTALRIADIGTGSGAILLALLHERPDATGIGTDINSGALKTAALNAHRLGLADRAGFVVCNYAEGLTPPFDLIVSNPPYIASAELAGLDKEVRDFDPALALDGGADGLTAYRNLAKDLPLLLRAGGAFALEVGHNQAAGVASLLEAAGLAVNHPFIDDLAGIPRVVSGRKRAE